MSLTGNLEDLPLLDIIQIVSFSKKTGFLTIRTSAGEGAIVFLDGFVVASFAWDDPPLPADLPADKRPAVLRNRIEMALQHLIRLREGQFDFSLTTRVPPRVAGRDITAEVLEDGINPQELLLDLARGIDEDRRDSSAALEASFADSAEDPEASVAETPEPAPAALTPPSEPVPAAPEPTTAPVSPEPVPEPAPAETPPAAAAPVTTVLLVDDEDDVRALLARRFGEGGYDVHDAPDPNVALKLAKRLTDAGTPFLVVTDLGMPTSGGSSFQGGFEVVKRLVKMKVHPPVLMMAESLSPALRARARQMGVAGFVFKPGLSRLDPEQFEADLEAFARKLVADVLPALQRKAHGAPQRPAKPKAPPGPAPSPAPEPAPVATDEMRVLQQRLEELRRQNDPSQIAQSVMKMAREFFERAVLLLVKDEGLHGLGGFGPAPRDESLNLLVRDVSIPLSEPSVFLTVVSERHSYSGPIPDERWCQHLMGKIGRFGSTRMTLLPLLTHRETMAVLFGDNPETDREAGRLDVLEVFITQAGVALENAFLQRKLQALQTDG